MSQRTERVQKLARQVLGELIQQLKDPRIGFVTVTAVRVTPDLRHARAFVSVLGSDEERELTMRGLRSSASHLRAELGHEMKMKYVPDLVFELDETPEHAQRLESLMRQLHEEGDL
ncbi:MAG: 30S ribosome-binding factor RbfA [Actinomycetota bacterium]|nr:30S ribosome-binding factor RbfA [Actinomycetota bacterium]